ncbi:non-ribosomal peptide synthetase, partial [Aquimarina longa]|uniref:non-ribosomal peptide synthetase n=1 Tax=Aquimarina longa TaxID=1080221 RepID=UPI000A895071
SLYVKNLLPEYMVPQLWVSLDVMPLTSNGKIDRRLLPEPDLSTLSSQEYVAPRNEQESGLCFIWQELLGLDQVGVYDDFFELGGHSLLATRLVSMIRRDLGIEVSIRSIFMHTTISDLCVHLGTSEGSLLPAIVAQDRPDKVPLSFSQERLWFLDQLQGSLEYHMPIVLRLRGTLDVAILEDCLRSIVSRHEVLRTVIYSEGGIGYQRVISSEDWSLSRSFIGVSSEEGSIISSFLETPFDLSRDYMFRACLYDLGERNYVLAGVFHHIASDGWSNGILVSEFTSLYSSSISGSPVSLPILPVQYSDYALWQREYVEGLVLEDELSYWDNKLSGVSALLLPTDYMRPSVQSTLGSSVDYRLDEQLSQSLIALSQSEGVTLFMLLLSGFKVLLSRYSGQDDICVGIPIANRTQSDIEGMIGFFVNTLALRSDLSGNPSFREVLGRVKETTLGGYDHQLAPFEKVVDRVVASRDMSMTPLFQVMFDVQNSSEERNEGIEGLDLSAYEYESTTSQFDLNLSIEEDASGFIIDLEYCTALFDESTIVRMLVHYEELLRSIVLDAGQDIGSLSILTSREESELVHVLNATDVSYPLEKTFVSLFEEQVLQNPEAIALVYGSVGLTYKEVSDRSNQLAHYLRDQGVVSDSLVGICIERSLDMVIGILGILKSGGAYVPIKPDYPVSRISHMVDDTGLDIILTDVCSVGILEDLSGITCVVLDSSESAYLTYSKDSLSLCIAPSSLSYVIYTSGSTGFPKGAMIEHRGLLNHLLVMIDALDMDSDSVVAFTAPFTFDISVWQLLSGLLCGGRIVVYSESSILDARVLQDHLYDDGVTILQLVPSYVSELLEVDSEKDLSKLNYFLVTGEAAQVSLVSRWFSRYPDIPVVNAYGPAEASDDVTLHILRDVPQGGSVSIGKPIANTQLYVVDSLSNLCPIGVVGELWVSGVGVGRGYINDIDKTRDRFISNPFVEGEYSRVYKTGDLGRWLSDGTLEFVGRSDDQVKIHGYRIELGEIDSILSTHVAVVSCCVLARRDGSGINRLVGYVVVSGDFDARILEEYLSGRLPEYMVPRVWVDLEVMPLTGNGKIDKNSLPDPDVGSLSRGGYIGAATVIEEQLVGIWEELLDLDKVGVEDNFFELGGHSLLATRLISMIRTELSIEVEIADVFSYSTIRSLGEYVSTQSVGVVLPAIVSRERPEKIPLSFSQERLWFLDTLQGSLEYHMPTVLELRGSLDLDVLETCFRAIVDRHEVLRTVIYSEGGIGYQRVIDSESWELSRVVIEQGDVLEDVLSDFIEEPFDLSRDYMFRACVYDVGSDCYVLGCVFHHISSDGWSEGILISEFMELYSSLGAARDSVL